MTDTTTYTATITITSNGDDSAIKVAVATDPSAVQRVVEGRGLPAAYQAARDVQRFISMTSSEHRSFNMTDRELECLSEEDRMAAIREAAQAVSNTLLVGRYPSNVE